MTKLAVPEKSVTDSVRSTQPVQTIQASPEVSETVFLHFSLQDALPLGHVLVINRKLGTLSHIATKDEQVWLLGEQQFTVSEMNILLPLLDSFPFYSPYEVLFAHFYHDDVTEDVIIGARKHLQKAQDERTWDQEMRSVRTTLSRTRLKLRMLGLNISSILETGYILRVVALPRLSEET
ncbi:MAG: hypothetical protein NVS4B1_14500 [Ktedonobacteraceae bacterium]